MAGDIKRWLEDLDLAKYADVFIENEVGLRDLPHITDSDLREIGLPLGPRKRILGAISALIETETPASDEGVMAGRMLASQAERRQLTLMFCDLVGSTELSHQLDPEDLRDVMRRYQDAVAGAVARYQGHVAKFLGDGVLAYFGWPQAFEDQAEQAVRASLDAIAAVEDVRLDGGETLCARVGIATGQVVVGDLVGEVTSDLEAVSGEAPNLAARLQGVAEPGQIVIGATTHRLIGTAFVLEDLGPHDLKGFSETVRAWGVIGEGTAESRFEVSHEGTLTHLVGREHDLGLLSERWRLAKGGEGQIVLLSGEAGIGKSRMVQGLRDEIGEAPHLCLRYQCSPHHSNSAFYPLIQRLERAARFTAEDSAEVKLDKLEDLLRPTTDDLAAIAPLFAALLSLPAEHRYGPLDLTPPQRRERTIEALIGQVLSLSRQRPVLFIVEDAHWIDPSMEGLIGEIMARIADQPVFMLITHRPEYAPPWPGHSHLTSIALSRLGRDQGAEIVRSVGGPELSDKIVERIIARADGVPLYVEELTKSILETEHSVDARSDGDQIPTSLQASLVARLDRLEIGKDIAQIGAVIGRDFSHSLLASVAQMPDGDIGAALDRLLESGLVLRRGLPPNAIYTFKHALLQDAAYGTLLTSRRQRLHAKIVEILEAEAGDHLPDKVDLLAHHAYQGEDWDKAFTYLRQAGINAMDRSANREATAFLKRAIECLEHVTRSRESVEWAIDVRFDLRTALQALGELSRQRDHLREAVALAESLGDLYRQCRASNLMTQYYWWTGSPDRAVVSGEHLHVLVKAEDDLGLKVVAAAYLGAAYHALGDYQRAMDLQQLTVATLTGDRTRERFGQVMMPAVFARAILVLCQAERGEFAQGMVYGGEAIRLAEAAEQPYSLTLAHLALGMLALRRGDFAEAIPVLERGLELCESADVPVRLPWFEASLGHTFSCTGRNEEALPLLERAVERADTMNVKVDQSLRLGWLGEAYLRAGRLGQGFKVGERALSFARQHKERGNEAWQLRLLGVLNFDRDPRALREAESALRASMALSEELGMRPLSAHNHLALANLYRSVGDRERADHERKAAAAAFHALDMPFWLERERSNIAAIPSDPGS